MSINFYMVNITFLASDHCIKKFFKIPYEIQYS